MKAAIASPVSPSPAACASHIARTVAVVCTGLIVTAWLWVCFCAYPSHGWNDVRLTPSFMLRAGVTPYPGPLEGPLTTWIYGPVPLLLQLPSTFAPGAISALLLSSLLNLAIGLGSIWVAVRAASGPAADRKNMLFACCLVGAAWSASNWIFWQADNLAIAFGLLSIVCLGGSSSRDTARRWLAAAAGALAVWSKQTEIAPILAQIAFVYFREGARPALAQAMRCGGAAGFIGIVFLWYFGAEGLLYNMFVVPAALPKIGLLEKAMFPIFRGYIVILVVIPILAVAWKAKAIFHRESPLFLPGLLFLFSLPPNLAGFTTIGGNINSLHAPLYLLPAAAVALTHRTMSEGRKTWLLVPALVATIVVFQLHVQRITPTKPRIEGLRQGVALAQQFPHQIYFPWNPLLTFYTDGLFYHAEDGLMTRLAANKPPSYTLFTQSLPRSMHVVAYHGFVTPGPVVSAIPTHAKEQFSGEWVIFSWAPPGIQPNAP